MPILQPVQTLRHSPKVVGTLTHLPVPHWLGLTSFLLFRAMAPTKRRLRSSGKVESGGGGDTSASAGETAGKAGGARAMKKSKNEVRVFFSTLRYLANCERTGAVNPDKGWVRVRNNAVDTIGHSSISLESRKRDVLSTQCHVPCPPKLGSCPPANYRKAGERELAARPALPSAVWACCAVLRLEASSDVCVVGARSG